MLALSRGDHRAVQRLVIVLRAVAETRAAVATCELARQKGSS